MKYSWDPTGIGKIDKLGQQFEKVIRGTNQGSIKTRWRYVHASERFIKYLGEKFGMQNIYNLQDKHLVGYALYLKGKGNADKYIKNELSAIRWLHRQMPNAKFELESNSEKFNKSVGLGSTPDGRADRAWTNREFKAMVDIANSLNRQDVSKVIELMRFTGTRLDEACTLRKSDIENALKTGILQLTNTKGAVPRSYNIDQINIRLRPFLEKSIIGIDRGEYVFCPNAYVKEHRIQDFKKSIQNFIDHHRSKVQDNDRKSSGHNIKYGERGALTVHGIRHAWAREQFIMCIKSGYTPKQARYAVSERLGHHRERVTEIYLASLEREALEGILDIDI